MVLCSVCASESECMENPRSLFCGEYSRLARWQTHYCFVRSWAVASVIQSVSCIHTLALTSPIMHPLAPARISQYITWKDAILIFSPILRTPYRPPHQTVKVKYIHDPIQAHPHHHVCLLNLLHSRGVSMSQVPIYGEVDCFSYRYIQ